MAHFAQIENDIVTQVIVVNDAVLLDADGVEQESLGAAFCRDLFGGEWVQTSRSKRIRGVYAAPGFVYDRARDVFVAPAE